MLKRIVQFLFSLSIISYFTYLALGYRSKNEATVGVLILFFLSVVYMCDTVLIGKED